MDEPSEETNADERSLVFIDPSPEERSHVETLGEELGRPVWAVDPAEFSPEMIDSLSEAAAVVIAWDLGGRPGLDLVETLSLDPRLREVPIAVSGDAPTPVLVRAAWRAGARSFVVRPYEISELALRLLGGAPPAVPAGTEAGEAPAAPAATEAGEASAARESEEATEGSAADEEADEAAPAS